MLFLYCDETNMECRDGDFLLYGGLIVHSEKILSLSKSIDRLRTEYSVPRDYKLKFNPGPSKMAHTDFIALKAKATQLCVEHECRFIVYMISHNIATSPDEARRNGINELCLNYNYILKKENETGMVLIDRFNDKGNAIEAHLTEKFCVGLVGLPYSAEMRLENVVGLHYSAIGQSHIPSLVDIVLGSYRFAINSYTRKKPELEKTSQTILKALHPLFPKAQDTDAIPEIGISFSPKTIKSKAYKAQYQHLKDRLSESGYNILQEF